MSEVEQETEDVTTDEVIGEDESGFLENDPLNSIFGDKSLEETVIGKEVVTAPKEEKKVIEETVVTTEEEPKVEPKPKDEDAGWKAAYFAEKNKRQNLEKQPKEEPKPFDWTDPDKTIGSLKTELQQDMQTKFLDMSDAQCKARHKDYDEKYQVFVGMAQANPAVINSMLQQPDPAQYAYDLASQKMFTDEVGADPTTYKAKLEAEIRAKIELENNDKAAKKKVIVDGLPPSAASFTDKVPIDGVQKEPFDALFPGQVAS